VIKLKTPLLWDGHIVSEGKEIVLSAEMEEKLVSAGNGEYVCQAEKAAPENDPPTEPQNEKKDENAAPAAVDPEMNLGRTGGHGNGAE